LIHNGHKAIDVTVTRSADDRVRTWKRSLTECARSQQIYHLWSGQWWENV